MSPSSLTPLLRVAWRNALVNWRHSLMAIVSVSAGFVALSVFQNYMVDVKQMYEGTHRHRFMLGDLIIEHGEHAASPTSGDSAAPTPEGDLGAALSPEEQEFLEKRFAAYRSEVQGRARFLEISGTVNGQGTSAVFAGYGYDVSEGAGLRGKDWRWNTLAGKPLERAGSVSGAVILGRGLAALLDCRPDADGHYLNGVGGYRPVERPFHCASRDLQLSVATEAGQANAMDATPVGILDAAYRDVDTRFVAMPLPLAQQLFDTRKVSYIVVELRPGVDVRTFAERLRSEARASGVSLTVTPWQDHRFGDIYQRTMSLLTVFRDFVVAVILVIAGLSVLNTMIKIVTERVREIGTLASLGFTQGQIVLLFTAEAFFLAAAGIWAGLSFSIFFSGLINQAGLTYKAGMLTEPVPFRIAFSIPVYLLSALFLSAIAVLAAWVPARRASGKRAAELLAHV